MEGKKQLLEFVAHLEQDRREYLSAFFKYIPETIAREMRYAEVAQNEYILQSGFPSDTVFIILQGQVIGLDYQKMGRVYSFMDFSKMFIIGDFELFSNLSEYCVSIRALKDCKLLKISSKSYLNWIRHDENALFLRLSNTLSTLTLERKFEREYIYMDCRARLEYYLIKFYEKEKKKHLSIVKVEKTQADLAESVGFNKRSVQRSIAALEKDKLITMENGKITISQEQYLRLREHKGDAE